MNVSNFHTAVSSVTFTLPHDEAHIVYVRCIKINLVEVILTVPGSGQTEWCFLYSELQVLPHRFARELIL